MSIDHQDVEIVNAAFPVDSHGKGDPWFYRGPSLAIRTAVARLLSDGEAVDLPSLRSEVLASEADLVTTVHREDD